VSQVEENALAGGERQEVIDHCLAGISRLSNEVTDVASSIPAYDQRTYSQVRETSALQAFGSFLILVTGRQSTLREARRSASQTCTKEQIQIQDDE